MKIIYSSRRYKKTKARFSLQSLNPSKYHIKACVGEKAKAARILNFASSRGEVKAAKEKWLIMLNHFALVNLGLL